MYIDADEIFDDVSDIITFFRSREYKLYKSASYIMENIKENLPSVIFQPLRLIKLEKDTRFYGRVHETLHFYKPVKSLEVAAKHYGYNYEAGAGDEAKRVKHLRNIAPLLEMHEEGPGNYKTMFLLAHEYVNDNNYDEAKKYIDIGLELVKSNKDNIYYHGYFKYLVDYFTEQERPPAYITIQGRLYSTALEHISLNLLTYDDISQLGYMVNLTNLGVNINQLSNTTPLAELANLIHLELWGHQVIDITPLAKLTNLTDLYLANNKITDITPLAELTNLTTLDLCLNDFIRTYLSR